MKNSETKTIAEALWNSARNSLDRFLRSTEASDIDWRNAKQEHLDYIEARMKEIKSWINGEIKPEDIGPLADARNIFWDEPVTSLQKEYCESVFQLFYFLRKQSIGILKAPTRPVER
jgi:hypothetical protein